MSMLGKPLTSICDVPRHNPQILQMLDSCYVDASSPQQWNSALRFSSQQNMEALLFVFNQIGGESTIKVEPSETLVTDKSSKEDTHRELSLTDPEVKFAVRLLSATLSRHSANNSTRFSSSSDSPSFSVAASPTRLLPHPSPLVTFFPECQSS